MNGMKFNCSGMGRRDFLQVGLGGMAGLGFSDLLRAREANQNKTAKPMNCILVWLDGGPSHYESFDPKPDAPKEIRGEFGSMKTSVPGVHFCDKVPNLAKVMDKMTIVRSISHKDPNHGGGNHYLMTGRPTPVPVNCGAFVTFHPSFGSMVSYERGMQKGLPPYMSLGRMSRSGGPNFLGAQHAPFVIGADPSSSSFRVRDVVLPKGISDGRADDRRGLRVQLDNLLRITDKAAKDPAVDFDRFNAQGVDLVTSKEAQAAFDISKEDKRVREKYGKNSLGQRMLLARRLVEVGVSFVTVYYGGWDHHRDIFKTIKGEFNSKWDVGLSALISDLDQRGMLDNTMVICLGEFGRTPKVNSRGGRDHWPGAMSVLFAGGGVPKGQVVGATDAKGYYGAENVYSPEDFASSLYLKMGIDPEQVLYTETDKPVQLVDGGQRIKELFA
jgi:hypothetical protein